MKASRLDFLFRSKPGRTAPEAPSFETIWPADARGTKAAPPPRPVQEPSPQPVEPPQAKPSRPAPEPAPVPPPAAVSVLKSGVVDGMPYTLYSDGSIEAQLPEGTIRFSSVAELRSHIETSS